MSFLRKRWLSLLGVVIVLILIVVAIFAGVITSHDPNDIHLELSFAKPSATYLLGNDQNGCDIFSRLIYGARTSMLVGISTVIVCMTIGLLIGLFTGYLGGFFDSFVMRIVDMFLAFPGILLSISIAAFLTPSVYNVIIALSIVGWVSYARLVRSQVLTLKSLEYVQASKVNGAGIFRVLFIHILPNLIAPLCILGTFNMAGAIIAEASLSFLGIGASPVEGSWGVMLDVGRQHLLNAPRLAIYPGIAIMMTVMAFNFIGDGLRDLFDPKV